MSSAIAKGSPTVKPAAAPTGEDTTKSKDAADTPEDGNEADDKDLAEFGDIVRTVQSLGVGINSQQSPGQHAITSSPSFGPLGVPTITGGSPKESPVLGATKGDLNSIVGAPALAGAADDGKDAKKAQPAATASDSKDGKDAKSTPEAGAAMLASGSVATGGDDSDDDTKKRDPNAELKDIGDIPLSKSKKFYDVRVAVVGNVDSGKSTLVGVLTGGALDNGRGLARSRIFVHQHEQANGRTSCISQHIMGFDSKDNAVYQSQPASASSAQKTKSWKAVVSASRSLVTFIDLAGHERYLKTTIAGLTGCFPDYAIVIINSLAGISKMTREHLGVILALEIPFACIVSKIDMCPANVMERTKNQLFRILKSQHAKKLPITVRDEKDIVTCLDNNQSMRICPVFLCSAVTGKGMDLLIKYLGGLKPRRDWQITRKDKLTEFHIDETFNVTGVGIVISGTVSSGTLTENSNLLMGPGEDGTFKEVQVKTIHCKRVAVDKCEAGDSCAISLRALKRKEPLKRSAIRRGMVLVDPSIKPTAARNFEAEVLVLHHPTTIKMSYQAVIHCGIIRQTAAITNISKDCLRTGDKATVSFRFMIRPEYLHLGSVFIFREGNTKGIGKISKIIYEDDPTLAAMSNGVTPPKKRTGEKEAEDDPEIETADDASATATAAAPAPAGSGGKAAAATATTATTKSTAAADSKSKPDATATTKK